MNNSWWLKLQERLWGMAPWDAERISDEWFRAHFDYAANVVHQWMGSALDMRTARLLNFWLRRWHYRFVSGAASRRYCHSWHRYSQGIHQTAAHCQRATGHAPYPGCADV